MHIKGQQSRHRGGEPRRVSLPRRIVQRARPRNTHGAEPSAPPVSVATSPPCRTDSAIQYLSLSDPERAQRVYEKRRKSRKIRENIAVIIGWLLRNNPSTHIDYEQPVSCLSWRCPSLAGFLQQIHETKVDGCMHVWGAMSPYADAYEAAMENHFDRSTTAAHIEQKMFQPQRVSAQP